MSGQHLSILIPAYNESEGIRNVVTTLCERYPDAEIIVCDDGSTDGTADALDGLEVHVIRHRRNRGYGAAWKSLAAAATRDLIIYFDGDSQFDPDDVARLLAARAESGADLVSGHRTGGSGSPLSRRPGKLLMRRFAIWLAGEPIPDVNCGLRVFDRETFLRFLPVLPDGFSCSTTSLLAYMAVGRDVHFVPIEVRSRTGRSSVRIIRDGLRSLLLIIRLTTLFSPMRVFLPVAAGFLTVGLAYSLYEGLRFGLGVPILGATLLINGVIVFLFGILTDQVAALRLERLRLGNSDSPDLRTPVRRPIDRPAL
jgi:glycosyltransferase involved in cell wall biosynthesis